MVGSKNLYAALASSLQTGAGSFTNGVTVKYPSSPDPPVSPTPRGAARETPGRPSAASALLVSSARAATPKGGAMYSTGVYAVLVTPLNSDGTVDHAGLTTNVEFLATSECGALVALGSEGEFYALTDAERRPVVETTVSALRGRKPLVVGVAHPST